MTIILGAIKKRSHEPMYKTDAKVGKDIFNNKKSTAYKALKINSHFGVVAIIFSPTVLTIMINDSTVSRYFSKENERISSQCTTVQ